MDKLSAEQRHNNMSHIHGKDTKPELVVRKYLFSKGLRYRKNDKNLPGHPDIVFPKYKTVVFVNGCFWHGHEGCKYFKLPDSNRDFWAEKINENITRDERVKNELIELGWRIIIVWQCQLRRIQRTETLEKLLEKIISNHI